MNYLGANNEIQTIHPFLKGTGIQNFKDFLQRQFVGIYTSYLDCLN